MKSRVRILVFGIVQGVFFRANTVDMGRRLGLSGFARNLPNGSVEIIAEGEKKSLEELVEWCSHGPSSAQVSKIEHKWEENKDEFSGFTIRY